MPATRWFRGQELPRLLVLAVIAFVGWPLVCISGGRPRGTQPQRPAPIADLPPLPPPDDSVVFAGLQDKAPLNLRDNPALAELLDRARKVSATDLAAEARRDVGLVQLIQQPDRHRGLPIHVEGTARQISRNEVDDPLLTRQGHLYEAWVYATDEPRYPFCLMFEVPPEGLPGGRDIHEFVGFDGYFLKLLAYDAGDMKRFAPLLVGRLGWSPGEAARAAEARAGWLDRPFPGLPYSRRHVMLGLLGVMMLATMARIALGAFRGRGRGARPAGTQPRANLLAESIDRDDLAAFLKGETRDEEGPDVDRPADAP